MIAGDSRRLVQLKHFSTVNMRREILQGTNSNAIFYWT